MRVEEKEGGCGDPEPGDFHEEDVEEVGFAGEVVWSVGGGVGLCGWIVGGGARGWVEKGEEGAEEEKGGVEA